MTADLVFGPEGDQWIYDRSAQTYDLTRGSKVRFSFLPTRGPDGIKVTVDPEKTALVVVDMQNFFLHPSCRSHPTGLEAVAPIIEVISKCREMGIQVVWLNWGLNDTDMAKMPATITRSFQAMRIHSPPGPTPNPPPGPGLGNDMGNGKGRQLFAGSWNAEIYEPLQKVVRPEDVHCAKNRMSGMWTPEQPLYKHLKSSGKKTLLFTGVNTDHCVLGTLVDAYNGGWDCIVLEDCTGTMTPGAKEVCIQNSARGYGFVTDSKGILSGKLS